VRLEDVVLKSYTVLDAALSVRLQAELPTDDAARMLRRVAEATRGHQTVPLRLDRVSATGSIESIGSSRGDTARLLLHLPKTKALADALFWLHGRPLTLTIGMPGDPVEDDTLRALLAEAAERHGTTPEALLESLTTFTARDGRVVPGRRAIDQLSDAQRPVVADRLRRLLDAHAPA
jgi:hypothetical protein